MTNLELNKTPCNKKKTILTIFTFHHISEKNKRVNAVNGCMKLFIVGKIVITFIIIFPMESTGLTYEKPERILANNPLR
jgi:hypothetical protein